VGLRSVASKLYLDSEIVALSWFEIFIRCKNNVVIIKYSPYLSDSF
jgi:hypothetical protein